MSKIEMRDCVLVGNMGSDETTEQYPEGIVCTDCIEQQKAMKDNSCIMSAGNIVNNEDAVCVLCERGTND